MAELDAVFHAMLVYLEVPMRSVSMTQLSKSFRHFIRCEIQVFKFECEDSSIGLGR